jgi:hypothetical protein
MRPATRAPALQPGLCRAIEANRGRTAGGGASPDPGKQYLEKRATALETDDYQPSDFAWMDMKQNQIDLVIGPIENYEDQLYGYRTAFEAYVLVKDMQWSERLARFTKFLPEMQRNLPVPANYRKSPRVPPRPQCLRRRVCGRRFECRIKTIAINLPNDEEVALKAGTRRLQLKNAIRRSSRPCWCQSPMS